MWIKTPRNLVVVMVFLVATCMRSALAADDSITAEEATAFAMSLERAAASLDRAKIDELVDYAAMMSRALEGLGATETRRVGFTEEFIQTGGFGTKVVGALRDGNSYALLRVREIDGEVRPLMRIGGKAGIVYHYLHLARTAGGIIRIVDMDPCRTGESLAALIRRLFIDHVVEAGDLAELNLAGTEAEYAAHFSEFEQIKKLAGERKFEESLRVYDALPKGMRELSFMMLVRIDMANALERKEFATRAIDEYAKVHPEVMNIEAIRLNDLSAGKWDEAIALVDKIDKRVGGDPLLNISRANLLVRKHEINAARAALEKGIEQAPKSVELYQALFHLDLDEKRWEDVASMLTRLEKMGGNRIEELGDGADFKEFKGTEAYKKWVRRYEAESKAPITVEQAREFALSLEKAAGERDVHKLNAIMDNTTIVHKALDGMGVGKTQRDDFTNSFLSEGRFGVVLLRPQAVAHPYRLLRIREVNGQPRPLMRVFTPGELDYHSLHLGRDSLARIRVVDMDIYYSGETLTASWRRAFLGSLRPDQVMGLTLSDAEKEYVANAAKIHLMATAYRSQECMEAMRVHELLPQGLRRTMPILKMRVVCTGRMDDAAYAAARKDLAKFFPEASNQEMIRLSSRGTKKNTLEETLAILDQLDKRLGGDPLLNIRRADALLAEKDVAAARAALMRGIEQAPKMEELHLRRIDLELEQKQWAKLAAALAEAERRADVRIDHIEDRIKFGDFVKSDEYKEYRKSHPAATP